MNIKKLRKLRQVFLIAISVLGVSIVNFAQTESARIQGTVTDANGAAVAGATVTIKGIGTGREVKAVTDTDGSYSALSLQPGKYQIDVGSANFKTTKQDVTLEVAQTANLNFVLEAGSVSETVTVTLDVPQVETATSALGEVIQGREAVELPLNGRNVLELARLTPGVTQGIPGGFATGVSGNAETYRGRNTGGAALSINGQRTQANNFLLDGVDNNESQFGQIAIFPNPDAIAEFKIETSVPSAESGRAGGGIVSTTFKSGGNSVHGTVYENYQGRFLSAAASQFDDDLTNRVPNYVTHNFGGVVGGPIYLPRPGEGTPFFYDGRNRSFFFFSTELRRNATPIFGGSGDAQAVPVPTARMRVGDFGELLRPGTRTYNLAGGGTVVAQNGTIFAPNGTPIPGNDLRNCPSCGGFSPFASAYLNAFPLPNLPGAGRNYRTNRAEGYNLDSYDLKIDHRITDSNSFFARYSRSTSARQRDNFFPLGASPNGNDLPAGPSAGDEFGNSRGFTMGDTHTFGSSVVNDARFGFNRVDIGIFNTGVNGTGGFSPTVSADLGARNINLGPNSSGIVLIGIVDELNGADRATEFTGDGGPFYFLSNNFNFADAVTVVKGNQTLKFGGDLRLRQNSNFDGGRNGGTKANTQYGTTGSGFVSGNYNGIGANDTGSSLANFLLGYRPGFITRGDPGGPYFQSNKEIAFFVQDDWKATPTLTLNLGLRYDIFTSPTERYDAQSNFDPATRTIIVAGDNAPGGRDLAETDKNNFGPRVGFAYSGLKEDRSLVVRGGYGIVYSTDVSGQQPLTANPGTGAASFSCNPITNPGGSGCAGLPLRNPFDVGIPTARVIVAAPGSRFAAPTDRRILFNDPNRRDAYFHQYNLTGQYEFAPNWLAEVAYVGSLGRNLLTVGNIGTAGDQGGPGSREVLGINEVIATRYTGSSRYDAMQSKLEKRFSRGLSIISSYTWSHAIDDSPGGFCGNGTGARDCGPDNPLRPELERGNSDTDIRHRFTFANVYDLPLGRGRAFGGDLPEAVDFFVGGFQFNNIVTWQSGNPYTVTVNGGRVDLIGDPTPTAADRAAGREINRLAFREARTPVFASDPGGPKIGSLGRNVFRGRQQFYWDASLFKNYRMRWISEDFAAQFRFTAFNVLNRVNRSRPNGDLNNTGDFGRDTSEQRRRQLEFAIKLIF